MDIRVRKTRKSIVNAFMELRAGKPLEKITVKELCQRAEINKSTFYTYYADVFDLSNRLEAEVIQQIIENLPHPEYILQKPKEFTEDLFAACFSQSALIEKLFSGNQSGHLVWHLDASLRELVFRTCPQYRDDPFVNVYLTYAIFGCYYAMFNNRGYGDESVTQALSEIVKTGARALDAHIGKDQ